MNTFKQSAIEILNKVKTPLHYSEITRLALESGILETEGATPEASMNAQITVDIKNKGQGSDFIKTAPGTFTLNLNKLEIKETPKIVESEKEEEEKIVIAGGFTGKAGEHLVCSELLFRGFNASIMSVDVGMVIVAVKENQLFGIQVKTSNLNSFNTYVFDIRKVSFERHSNGNVFYIIIVTCSPTFYMVLGMITHRMSFCYDSVINFFMLPHIISNTKESCLGIKLF